MTWKEIRQAHANEWVIIEAVRETHNPFEKRPRRTLSGEPAVETLALVDHFREPRRAMEEFCRLRARNRGRELYVVPANLEHLVLDPLELM